MGDITKIDVGKLEPVDIICAGSPCQDLSVAGKREGLAGERSGLFRTAIELVHGLRKRTGSPRYFVWENVPGAFSSNKGLDFRAVLEEISQTEIPMPACGKWAESGMVEWDGGSLAWRTLDAQYWGVPQRRKRIFLVADFAGHSAGEILFEPQSVPRDSSESREEREKAAGNARESIDSASGCLTPRDVWPNRAVHPINLQVATRHIALGRGTGFGVGNNGAPAYTLEAGHSHGVAVYDIRHSDSTSGVAFREGSYGSFVADHVAGTSKASGGVLGGGSETLIKE